MTIGIIIVLTVIYFLLGPRPIITIIVALVLGKLLCDIDVAKEYVWYSGIWHGLFFVPNFIRYLILDAPYKAELYTSAYNVFYWIFSILSTIGYLFGGGRPERQY